LLKTDAKFYAIHVSPSQKELQSLGNTEQEQAEAMKRYIREVFIPEYAKNFNKGLSAKDIKFYGKIHFDRSRSDNKQNVHCHLIVSRKDQSNKVKISPLTNHRNTKKGAIKGGFNRKTLFENVEKGFDRLFGYNRQLSETFEYCNTMKNGSITEKLKIQERELKAPLVAEAPTYNTIHNQKETVGTDSQLNSQTFSQPNNQPTNQSNEQTTDKPINQSSDLGGLFSFLPSTSDICINPNPEEEQFPRKPKKKKRQRRIT
jgi:hypothetical protein